MLRNLLIGNLIMLSTLASVTGARAHSVDEAEEMKKGYDIRRSRLMPVYPEEFVCSPLSSLYASWTDVDGSRRDQIHSGVDGGQLGEPVLAPAPGVVKAVWLANWGWGKEGALLIEHRASEINVADGALLYYTAFDHLKYDDIKHLKVGQTVSRGEPLARVYRPGGHAFYLPEVHWEVWEVQADEMTWVTNRHGGREWRNPYARLIDPLYLLGINNPPLDGRSVRITPFEPGKDYSSFRGFTYIFDCRKR